MAFIAFSELFFCCFFGMLSLAYNKDTMKLSYDALALSNLRISLWYTDIDKKIKLWQGVFFPKWPQWYFSFPYALMQCDLVISSLKGGSISSTL